MANKTICVTALALSLMLVGCASQFAKPYIGRDVTDLALDNGPPLAVVDLLGGRRAYQYYWGGGTFVTPQTSSGTVNVIGNTAIINTQTAPATVVSSPGCIINFIAERRGDRWMVVEAKWPNRAVC